MREQACKEIVVLNTTPLPSTKVGKSPENRSNSSHSRKKLKPYT